MEDVDLGTRDSQGLEDTVLLLFLFSQQCIYSLHTNIVMQNYWENSAHLSLCSAWLSWSIDFALVYNWHGGGGGPNCFPSHLI